MSSNQAAFMRGNDQCPLIFEIKGNEIVQHLFDDQSIDHRYNSSYAIAKDQLLIRVGGFSVMRHMRMPTQKEIGPMGHRDQDIHYDSTVDSYNINKKGFKNGPYFGQINKCRQDCSISIQGKHLYIYGGFKYSSKSKKLLSVKSIESQDINNPQKLFKLIEIKRISQLDKIQSLIPLDSSQILIFGQTTQEVRSKGKIVSLKAEFQCFTVKINDQEEEKKDDQEFKVIREIPWSTASLFQKKYNIDEMQAYSNFQDIRIIDKDVYLSNSYGLCKVSLDQQLLTFIACPKICKEIQTSQLEPEFGSSKRGSEYPFLAVKQTVSGAKKGKKKQK
ncbi:UNKNOWN [Stylonychia lemnae]|uniref:Kelch motif family protein n=1 Tax=Stylonychia lemnae TaxID=5949 RepID=A0A078B314_STYLE|nr:UNKNOWN [Stylonychia lemnae]|eukprot:CDW88859.1 UNKNOWN [Stylonychia lemnae]